MYERRAKRVLDIAGAALLLVLLAPFMAATAIAVLIVLGRPVLFVQLRMGHGGVPFTLLKFRSMAEGDGPDAARLGRFGRALRAGAFDEMPQLLQVLRGQMSLVGPRPLLPADAVHYTPRQRTRLQVRPGLTGLAQVSGRNALPWAERLELDARYVEAVSLRGDIAILLRTPLLLLSGHGAAPSPRFARGDEAPPRGIARGRHPGT